jgi:hypothetical protein
MRKYIFAISILAALVMSGVYLKANQDKASDKNSKTETTKHEEHGSHQKGDEAEHKHADGESKEHGHGDEHAKNEEENPQVGPNKGILAASEDEGIKLSPEAEKNFEIQKLKVSNPGSIEIPKDALVTAGVEVNLYRYRAGFYKRIDFEQLIRSKNKISIRSRDLQSGDEIAITGLGFLRIAEIAAFGGAPEGHSH